MGRIAVVVAALCAGCLQSTAIVCDDGRTCPPGSTCGRPDQGCVLHEQEVACEGLAENEPCDVDGASGGRCIGGACIIPACGNRIVEWSEACDDGNAVVGDGCSIDCLSTEICGNGVLDAAAGEECDDGNNESGDTCQATCLAPRCGDGVVDALLLEGCDLGAANSDAPDAPCRTSCLPRRCADAILDPQAGEVCDDGNVVGGDGCTPDCSSNETCPNGVTDVLEDETCDDNNLIAGDGCNAACQRETPTWQQWTSIPMRIREAVTSVYDTARGRVMAFGGVNNRGAYGDTWEWDGGGWYESNPPRRPPIRHSHAMAFDGHRRRAVLFGGWLGSAYADTWEWDGSDWAPLLPVTSPPPRLGHTMAYDAARRRVVLFGGTDVFGAGGTLKGDTWEWDGVTWTERTPALSPSPRNTSFMTYDPIRGRVVLFGGSTATGAQSDTWEWDGTTWTERVIATPPPAREYHRMVFDAKRGVIVMFSGRPGTTLRDTWEWDGTTWSNKTPTTTSPPWMGGYISAFDLQRGRVQVAHGAGTGPGDNPTLWEWDGTAWTSTLPSRPSPLARTRHAMVYQALQGNVLLFGGSNGAASPSYFADTWRWNGRWTQLTPTASPGARAEHGMVYLPTTGNTLVFGGFNGTELADGWEFNGTTWTAIANGPPARRGPAMAYDIARDRVVVFGGSSGGTQLDDTWEWDGATWTNPMPATRPPMRADASLAYDPARARIVLFGGRSGNDPSTGHRNDTWEWDGVNWTQKVTAAAPPPRSETALTFDVVRSRIVAFGGTANAPANDTWEWDGTTWTLVGVASPPTQRRGHAMVFDAVRREIVLFGGSGTSANAETWLYRWQSSVRSESCTFGYDGDNDGAIGCADPDCFGYCAPLSPPTYCPASAACDATAARCGDGTCSAQLETCRSCPADCGTCTLVCGDFLCDTGETAASCPGDCTVAP